MLLSIAIRSGCPMELSDVAHRAMLQTRAKRIHNTNLKGNTEFRIVKYCINAQGGPPPSHSNYVVVYLNPELA